MDNSVYMLQTVSLVLLYFVHKYLAYQMYVIEGRKLRLVSALHILILYCFILASETGLPTCVQ
jgi:hypothetical protein